MRLKSCMLMCSLFMASLASASNFASDSFKTKSGKELTITFIKHGSLMLTYDNHSIQVDPVSEYADYTTFPKADIILITHEHGDHLDGNHRQREQPEEAGKREGPEKRRYGYLHQLYEDRGRPRL